MLGFIGGGTSGMGWWFREEIRMGWGYLGMKLICEWDVFRSEASVESGDLGLKRSGVGVGY